MEVSIPRRLPINPRRSQLKPQEPLKVGKWMPPAMLRGPLPSPTAEKPWMPGSQQAWGD